MKTKLSCSLIIEKLQNIHTKIKDLRDEEILHGSSVAIKETFDELDHIAACEMTEQEIKEISSIRDIDQICNAIQRLRYLYSERLEVEHARAVLASRKPWDVIKEFHFYRNYRALAKME